MAVPEYARVRRKLDFMMMQDTPLTYLTKVNGALKHANENTGAVRKAIGEFGRKRYRNVRHGEGSYLNPLTYPARAVKTVGAVGRGIGRGAKGLWSGFVAFLNQKNKAL